MAESVRADNLLDIQVMPSKLEISQSATMDITCCHGNAVFDAMFSLRILK